MDNSLTDCLKVDDQTAGGKSRNSSLSLGGPQYNLKPGIWGIIFLEVLRLVGKSFTLSKRVTEDHGFRTGRVYFIANNKERAYCITSLGGYTERNF
jgi:hypothetical protein